MILLTGDLGFIGQHIVTAFEKTYAFVGYDLSDGQDIRNKFQLAKVFESDHITTIVHLAAEPGSRVGEKYPYDFITTNILGTKHLLDLAEEYKVEHFIFFSSSSIFGNVASPLDEQAERKPVSLYGTTKLAAEILCENANIPVTVIRPFSVYGENGRGDQIIGIWTDQIKRGLPITFFGDGTSKRGYVYVKDLVAGLMLILNRGPNINFEVFNLGGHEIISLNQFLEIFRSIRPDLKIKYLPLPQADAYENWATIDKARTILGWSPQADFKKTATRIILEELKKR